MVWLQINPVILQTNNKVVLSPNGVYSDTILSLWGLKKTLLAELEKDESRVFQVTASMWFNVFITASSVSDCTFKGFSENPSPFITLLDTDNWRPR